MSDDLAESLRRRRFVDKAPSARKPPLPRMDELAGRLRDGEAIADIAAEYDRRVGSLSQRLNHAGYDRNGQVREALGLVPLIMSSLPALPTFFDQGACLDADPELFFPPQGEKAWAYKAAKEVCDGCDVRARCLEWALAADEQHGVWGGTTARQRRKMRKRLAS